MVSPYVYPIIAPLHESVINQVCEYVGLTPDDLQRRCRKREYVLARQMAAYILFHHKGNIYSTRQIASYVGYKLSNGDGDHGCVYHAKDTFHKDLEFNDRLREDFYMICTRLGLKFNAKPEAIQRA